MPLFQLEIEKVYNGEYWVNRYMLTAATLSGTGSPAAAILNAERAIHDDRILFTKFNVRTAAAGDDSYITVPVNLMGNFAANGFDLMPLFAVVRVDFAAATGRPSRKYLRGVAKENQVDGFTFASNVVTSWQTSYANVVAAVTEFCDVDGDDIVSGAVSPKIGMRQLRRGSKKTVTP